MSKLTQTPERAGTAIGTTASGPGLQSSVTKNGPDKRSSHCRTVAAGSGLLSRLQASLARLLGRKVSYEEHAAYKMGTEAYRLGNGLISNPFEISTSSHHFFKAGYNAALVEDNPW